MSNFIMSHRDTPLVTLKILAKNTGATIYSKSSTGLLYIVPDGISHSEAWRMISQ